MAAYFVGPVMDRLINACIDYLKDKVGWETDAEKDLKKLQLIRPQIQAVFSAYSNAEIEDPALNKWYWQLRDAIDEADDVLDEIEYWKLQKPEISQNKGKRKAEVPVWNIFDNVKRALRIGKPAPKSDPNLNRLEEAVQKLNKISAQVSTFYSLVKGVEEKQQKQQLKLHQKRETGALITNVLLGRRKEMDFVSRWLIRNSYERQYTNTTNLYRNVSLLSIVGHGGMGKTTLLQHVYKDATTLFDVQMWACVSTDFDVKTLIKNILESLQNKKPDQENQETLVSLQKSLQSKVTSKRFLLVLDDIWEEDDAKWENVLAPLQYGSSGSKIVITTRLDSVATKFANLIKKRKKILTLKGLKEKKCLTLFNSHAFAGVENPDYEFRSIAGKMVKKLFGCPLAAKVIGGILNSYIDKSYWIKVLNTPIGKIEQGQNHLLPILKLSYMYLPEFLQNCFSFCCIFPQDHEFDKDDLVRMWISLGFIESSNIEEETPEDTGRRYFNIFVQKSFFDEFRNDSGVIYYKMHDLLHELARFVAAQECLRIVGHKAFPIPPTTRHLSINDISSLEAIKKLGEFKNLRSLFLSFSDDAEFNENIICEILKASKSIRLLAINFEDIIGLYKMTEDIGCLIHLRYLKFKCFRDFKLPRSISHLYHLQFLVLRKLLETEFGWKELMPNENCQVILDNLTIKDPSATNLIMEPLRRISSFRHLRFVSNDKLVSFPTETEQWLLQHSSSLLWLSFENLQSLESLPSSLECLSSLNSLYMDNVPQLKLLPNPPASLLSLYLLRLKSLQCLPSSLSTISSLRYIYLNELENLDYLPSCLPTRLLKLTIIGVPLLLELPDLPSSMERLELEKLNSLKCLPSSFSTLSSLTFLKLINIPLLESLPDLPSSLKELELENLESLQCLPSSLSTITSLTYLRFKNIPPLKSLSDLPSSLITLYLEDFKSLQCHPYSLLTFSSLTDLTLKKIPLFKSLPDLPSSLKTLYLEDLESLECQPSFLSTISSLTILLIGNIPHLESLPDLPSSLHRLCLEELESLQCLPSSLSAIPSLETLKLIKIPLLNSFPDLPSSLRSLWIMEVPGLLELPDLPSSMEKLELEKLKSLKCLPSSLSTFSSLTFFTLINIPLLESLPDLPSSLKELVLEDLESLQCLPSSLSTITSLTHLKFKNIPLLKSLSDLPYSLKYLVLVDLESLQSLPSSLSAISSLETLKLKKISLLNSLRDFPSSLRSLWINKLSGLLELPDLPASLKRLHIEDCQPQLMERYPNFYRVW